MMPPYALVSGSFKNWRGMTESGGRRVDKRLLLDITTVVVCDEDMLREIKGTVPLMADYEHENTQMTNSQLYRAYIQLYLRNHPVVAQHLDLIIAQREQTEFGLPIEVYFFLTNKVWSEFETIQSDIFDHLISMAPFFHLRLYQLEELLPSDFLKINQSCLVNIEKIKRFDSSIGASLRVMLDDGDRDYVSRRQLKTVKERLGL